MVHYQAGTAVAGGYVVWPANAAGEGRSLPGRKAASGAAGQRWRKPHVACNQGQAVAFKTSV